MRFNPMFRSAVTISLALALFVAVGGCDRRFFRAAPGVVTGGESFRIEVDRAAFSQGSAGVWTITSLDADVVPLEDIEITWDPANPRDFVFDDLPTTPVASDTSVLLRLTDGQVERHAHLRVRAPRVIAFEVPATRFKGGQATVGTAVLSGPAPKTGLILYLESRKPGIVALPESLKIVPGTDRLEVPIQVLGAAHDRKVTLIASLQRPRCAARARLRVAGVELEQVELALPSVVGGNALPGSVQLDGPAPRGGIDVWLQGADPEVNVGPRVQVAEGQDRAEFVVSTEAVSDALSTAVIARLRYVTRSDDLEILAANGANLSFHPRALRGGRELRAEISLDGEAGPGGRVFALASSSPNLLAPPAVVVPEGERNAFFSLTAQTVVAAEDAILEAASPDGSAVDATLAILPPAPARVFVDAQIAQPLSELPPRDGGSTPLPVSVVTGASGTPAHFVSNELVLLTDQPADLADFLAEFAAWAPTLVSSTDPADFGMVGKTSHVIRIDPALVDASQLDADLLSLEPEVLSELRFRDDDGMALFAAAAEARLAGYPVSVNFAFESAAIADKRTTEAGAGSSLGGDAWDPDAFKQVNLVDGRVPGLGDYLPPNHGVTTAWGYLQRSGMDGERVPVAILDAGFMSNDPDMPSDQIVATSDPGVTALDTPNPIACSGGAPCPWHGTSVAQVAAALIDNGRGIAGTGGQVVQPITIHGISDSATKRISIMQAVARGARILNLSYTGSIPATQTGMFDLLTDDTEMLRDNGIVVIAAAGNNGVNVDATDSFGGYTWEEEWWYPCENDGVVCVGGLNYKGVWHDDGSNYGGRDVDIYAPFRVHVGARPDGDASGATATVRSGTSFSAPYVAGVLAMVMAANPALDGNEALALLLDRAGESDDVFVDRVVRAQEAVRAALGDAPPDIEITQPGNGDSVDSFLLSGFQAEASDREDKTGLAIEWRSNRDGFLGTGAANFFPNLTPGTHTITATVTDSFGWTASDSITVHMFNAPPFMEILSPFSAIVYFEGESIEFRGESFDLETFQELRDVDVWWESSIDGVLGVGYEINASLSDGLHEIRFQGADPDGGIGLATVEIVVTPAGANTPPVIQILQPNVDPLAIPAGTPVFLQASAIDAEDGDISDQINWHSSVQGALGTGASLNVLLNDPNCGLQEHTIQAIVDDSDGVVRIDTTRINVDTGGPC